MVPQRYQQESHPTSIKMGSAEMQLPKRYKLDTLWLHSPHATASHPQHHDVKASTDIVLSVLICNIYFFIARSIFFA